IRTAAAISTSRPSAAAARGPQAVSRPPPPTWAHRQAARWKSPPPSSSGPGQWPENGEIDIMEDVNSLSEVSGTVHCGTDPGGPCNETSGIGSGLRACSGCQTGYHTYTMILNRTNTSAESIAFYLDGTSYFTATEAP